MSAGNEDVDINEAFDDILFGEEIGEKTGFAEGYKDGRTQLSEPYHLGYHRASQVAAQLGFYSGVLEYNLKANLFPEKVIDLANKLQGDIENFPKHNSDSIDILKLLEDIKLKYSRICSLAKIKFTYPEQEKLDF
ncbi:uncharacterized protein LOC107227210 [Neodiprion lecontei]|uniref:Uncharacterized protein LOC107227210 n=1 Tax=Neodiprion lecontei TaxID=441921 RepID=A0A6J0CAW1_NEOLC|nr:uncharacterized protein LOC107227210 [Neodiprion lecontei]